jgi:hypothetical protein
MSEHGHFQRVRTAPPRLARAVEVGRDQVTGRPNPGCCQDPRNNGLNTDGISTIRTLSAPMQTGLSWHRRYLPMARDPVCGTDPALRGAAGRPSP